MADLKLIVGSVSLNIVYFFYDFIRNMLFYMNVFDLVKNVTIPYGHYQPRTEAPPKVQ